MLTDKQFKGQSIAPFGWKEHQTSFGSILLPRAELPVYKNNRHRLYLRVCGLFLQGKDCTLCSDHERDTKHI
jgi:hypothetical protein